MAAVALARTPLAADSVSDVGCLTKSAMLGA